MLPISPDRPDGQVESIIGYAKFMIKSTRDHD